ncbi:hypothetical protein [Acinetobacter beijerinckii]|uniref:hypothetical protein n=1 Tax=Acinetobacter beijerinckii TaxID=262668 RepID=UPI004055145F
MIHSFYRYIENLNFWLFSKLIVHLKMHEFQYRRLTVDEIVMAKQVFGHLINYDEVKIFNIAYLPWQPIDIFMAPNGNLFVHQKYFCSDYSKASLSFKSIFIHELAHILQFQQGINVILKGAILQTGYYLSLKKYNPYHYELIKDKPYDAYNIEQQGDIAKDIFLKKIPNIIDKNKSPVG